MTRPFFYFVCFVCFFIASVYLSACDSEPSKESGESDILEPESDTSTAVTDQDTDAHLDSTTQQTQDALDAAEDILDVQDIQEVEDTTPPPEPPLFPIERCNGHATLCERRLDEVTLPGTHNAMSNMDDRWVAANQNHGISQQLEDGIRVLLLDTHPWRGDVYLCHAYCQLGSRLLLDSLADIEQFMKYHPHEVLVLFFEDYVSAAETEALFVESGLSARVHVQDPSAPWPTLRQMIESGQRLVVLAQSEGPPPAWYHQGWSLVFDTFYTYERVEDFDCTRNRGNGSASLFMVNHWLGAPLPAPDLAAQANDKEVLLKRAQDCAAEQDHMVNFLVVDFYDIGALFEVVDVLNAVDGVSP